jgi:hypothetical protein
LFGSRQSRPSLTSIAMALFAVGQDTPPAAAGAANLHSHHDQRLGAVLATAPQVAVQPAAEALIDPDRTAERLPIRIDHRTPQWVSRLPPEAQVPCPASTGSMESGVHQSGVRRPR